MRLLSQILDHYLPPGNRMFVSEPAKQIRNMNPRAKFAVRCTCDPTTTLSHASSETIARMMWDTHNERSHGVKVVGAEQAIKSV